MPRGQPRRQPKTPKSASIGCSTADPATVLKPSPGLATGCFSSDLQLTPELTRAENTRQPKLADPSLMPPPAARKQSFPYPSPLCARRVPEGALVGGIDKPIAQVVVPQFSSD